MSVTFSICKESIELVNNRAVAVLRTLYPEGFDRTPVVDPEFPEYGEMSPENPWELNVSNQNAADLLQTLGFWDEDATELCGTIDPAKLLAACENAIGTIVAIPEIDMGTDSVEDTEPGKCTVIRCGHFAGYYTNRYSKLTQLAVLSVQNDAVIGYA